MIGKSVQLAAFWRKVASPAFTLIGSWANIIKTRHEAFEKVCPNIMKFQQKCICAFVVFCRKCPWVGHFVLATHISSGDFPGEHVSDVPVTEFDQLERYCFEVPSLGVDCHLVTSSFPRYPQIHTKKLLLFIIRKY